MSATHSVRELFESRNGELCFVVGLGKSIKNAEKHLSEKHPRAFTIAINKAIETVPADYWFWMDLDAYNASKDHPNAKAAIRCGVNVWAKDYDEGTYLWERAGNADKPGPKGREDFLDDVWKNGKLAYSGVSVVGAAALAWRLGAYRIVFVGCENKLDEEYLAMREKADPSKDWRSIYNFTFARVAEAFMHREVWMHKKVMLADASHTGTEWGQLLLQKTTIPAELQMLRDFYEHLWATGKVPRPKPSLILGA